MRDQQDNSTAPSIEHLADRAPGTDRADPYEDVAVSALPDWWRDAVHEYRSHEMRPYRPSRFEDGAIVWFVIDHLESSLDASIRIVGVERHIERERVVSADGNEIMTIEHYRRPSGYTEYRVTSAEFIAAVRRRVLDARNRA